MLMVLVKDKSKLEHMESHSDYYKDSMTLVNKGREMEFVKILTVLQLLISQTIGFMEKYRIVWGT
jgi:hypothetical protein